MYIFYILASCSRVFTELYPQRLSNDEKKGQGEVQTAFAFYVFLIVLTSLIYTIRNIFYASKVKTASYHIFDKSLKNLVHRPMSFFDTTPSGIILNRFTKDAAEMENSLPKMLLEAQDYFSVFLTSFILLTLISPAHGVCLIAFIFYLKYIITSLSKLVTELQRMEKLALSPILSMLNEMTSGYITIQAYNKN